MRRCPWLMVPVLAAGLGCERDELCGYGPLEPREIDLSCRGGDPAGLAYADPTSLGSTFHGRDAAVTLDPSESYLELIGAGVRLTFDVTPAADSLGLHGGPCAQGCSVTPTVRLSGTPVGDLQSDYGPITSMTVCGGERVCQSSGGHLQIAARAFRAQLDMQLDSGVSTSQLTNPEPMDVALDFDARSIDVEGMLCTTDGSGWGAHLRARGHIDNLPPVAVVEPELVVDCAGPGGTAVTLDATRSWDADGDPLLFSWWRDAAIVGTQLSTWEDGPEVTVTAPVGTTTYEVQVVQSPFADSIAATRVRVHANCPE